MKLNCRFGFDRQLTFVMSAFGAHSVILNTGTAILAGNQRGSACFVMCPSFVSSRLGRFSLWMCHLNYY